MIKTKLWYPESLFDAKNRDSWFELIKSKQRAEKNDASLDATIQAQINWVERAEEADIYILPLHWNYYYAQGRQAEAIAFCNEANNKGVLVLSYAGGDQGITPPVDEKTLVYRQSGYRSKRKPNERTAPFFLSDPIEIFLGKKEEEILLAHNATKHVIGFCGMAPHGLVTGLKERAQVVYRNLKSGPYDTQALISSSNLRYKALQVFEKNDAFTTNYIIRQKYRGGVQTEENRRKTTEEYYQNQIDSDLILCIRGVGNFSLRFYETLAMGRIPVFIDTDSPLPNIGDKDWHDYIIWVDEKDIQKAPEIAQNWLQGKDILRQKRKNRKLWLDHFRLDNFWVNELNRLNGILNTTT
jgi:hypothetical protein